MPLVKGPILTCGSNRGVYLIQDPVLGSGDGCIQDVDPGLLLLWTQGQEHQIGNLKRTTEAAKSVGGGGASSGRLTAVEPLV